MDKLYPWLIPHYQQISSAFQQGHGHHALLFKSEQGVGTTQLVQAIAGRLLCTASGEHPCGQCHHCHLFNAGNHPDFYQLAPIENKDIGIDQVREINEKVSQHAKQNGNKVVIIQEIERLTENAANALLKTLEEPRENTYFLLQADLSASLMATIYSRCQSWIINVPEQSQTVEWLQSQLQPEIKMTQILSAVLINHRQPLSALHFIQQGLAEKRLILLRQFWIFYTRRSPLEILPLFDKTILFQQLDWLLDFLVDALKAKLQITTHWVCQDLARGVQQFGDKQSIQNLLKANQIMQQVRSDLMQINAVNQELILLDGLSRLITDVFEHSNSI